ncbi:MAG: SpoIIE family protein phosphatase [Bacteroidales bacterium]|nr:SpoIIE family protein phosphatase [Bacteroidales bacterium]
MIPHFIDRTIRFARHRRVVFLWIGLMSVSMFGQQLYFDQFSVSAGLAQSTVYKIIQDRNDIFWMGTQVGVSSFDGVEFTNYSSEDGLADNGVRAICEDRLGNIWFGHTGGGISRFDGIRFEALKNSNEFLNSNVTAILEDSIGHLWFTTDGSGVIELLNPQASLEQLDLCQYKGHELSDRVFGGHVDNNGMLYFVTDPNVKFYNSDSSRFDNFLLSGIPQYYATTCIMVDKRGNIWFGKYNGGLYRYDPKKDDSDMFDLVKAGLASNWVSTLFEDNQGNIWAGTWEGGLARISPDDQVDLFSNQNGLMGMKIWSIIQDREGNILIGTHENGFFVYKGEHFISYFEEDGLINSQVWAVLQSSNGNFWFGTNEGISILERTPSGEVLKDFHKLQGERIRFLEEDSNGTIWLGTMSLGVSSYDKAGRYSFEPLINNNIDKMQVTAMVIDKENNLWVGTLDGLIFYEIEHRKVARLTQLEGLKSNHISAVFADSENRIWVGSVNNGITLIDGNEFKHLDIGFDFTPRCFAEDLDGEIWIGTEGRGLIRYDPDRREIFKTFTVKDGLLANLINQLSVDRFNSIYVGTNKGMNIYLRSEDRLYSYTSRSGFVGIETKPNASLVDTDGNIWFGTVQGVTRYHPAMEARNVKEPLTHITGIRVNHESYPLTDGLSLSHKQNSIIFEYRCITLNPDAVQYQIMLEGVDQEWRPPDTQTRATYPALRHGRYTFLVRAKNSAGVWNDEPVSFQFMIRPPFYLTWYFILASIFTAGLAIFSYIAIRERALKRENAILEEKVRDRTAIVVAQKEELAQKNKDITDSIKYAKRIQFAILPEKSPFPDTFILFKPKDIVSGDFYWFTEVGDKEFFSAVDCTGHGVPGAFMSIIGHNSLTKIVREYGILEPGKILTQLNKEVLATLHQRSDTGDVYDGMDLALVAYDRKEGYLEYSGAFNPLYLIRNGEILETKANKVSIGRSLFNNCLEFTNHRIKMEPGDTVYLFSDGYADQFGGELMKKFKYKKLKELMLKIQPESMDRQRTIMEQTIEQWKGDVEQLDDILVIGRRF